MRPGSYSGFFDFESIDNGNLLSPGIYLVRVSVNGFTRTKRIVYLR